MTITTYHSDRTRSVILKLPYPPSINAYWLASGHRRYISKRGMLFKQSVMEYVAEFNIKGFGGEPVDVLIFIHPRSKKLMDIDNCAKPILDACQDAGLFDNDVQVIALHLYRSKPKKGGGCTVVISENPISLDVSSYEQS